MPEFHPHVRTALSVPQAYLAGLWKRLNTEPFPIWCQALSFKVLVTLLPLVLLATGIFGLVIGDDRAFGTVTGYLGTFLPVDQSTPLIAMITQLRGASGTLTVIASVAFLLTVMTMFSALRYVIGQAIRGHKHAERPILPGYLFDLRMMVQVGLLFVISFALTFGVNYIADSAGTLASWGLDEAAFQKGWGLVVRFVSLLVPWLISVLMFAQLYHFVPIPKTPKRSAFAGAVVTALLFELAKNLFTLYATYLGDFDRYRSAEGGGGSLGDLGGVFGIILALVFWVYLSGLTLVIGAWVTSIHEERLKANGSTLHWIWRQLAVRQRRARKRQVILDQKAREAEEEPHGPGLGPPAEGAQAAGAPSDDGEASGDGLADPAPALPEPTGSGDPAR